MNRIVSAVLALAFLVVALVVTVTPMGDSWTHMQAKGDSWTVVLAGDSWTGVNR